MKNHFKTFRWSSVKSSVKEEVIVNSKRDDLGDSVNKSLDEKSNAKLIANEKKNSFHSSQNNKVGTLLEKSEFIEHF